MATRFYSSVEYGSSSNSIDPDVLYYNASIINNTTASDGNSADDPQVVFNEVRQYPLLQDTSDYMMSVVRFSMNGATKNLPLFIPRIEPNQPNPNLTIYKVRFAGAVNIGGLIINFDITRPIAYVPENFSLDIPPAPNPNQYLNTNYYFVYTYTHFCSLVNTALSNLLLDVQAYIQAQPGGAGYIVQSKPPVLSYYPVTRLFSFTFDNRFWGQYATNPASNIGGETFDLLIEENLESLLTNFWSVYFNTPAAGINQGWSKILVPNANITIDVNPATGLPYSPATGHINYIVTQDYPSTSGAWSPIDALVITSSLLPLIPEQVSQPQDVGSSNIGWVGETAQSAFQSIASDISIKLNGAEDYRQFIDYVPTAEYRMVSLNTSRTPLQNIDLQLWWRNRLDNQLYPVRLYNGTSVSLKMMFRRKQLGV